MSSNGLTIIQIIIILEKNNNQKIMLIQIYKFKLNKKN